MKAGIIIPAFYNFNIKMDSLFSDKVYVKANYDGENLFYDKENNFYFLLNNLSSEELNSRIKTQISFYNDISDKYLSESGKFVKEAIKD